MRLARPLAPFPIDLRMSPWSALLSGPLRDEAVRRVRAIAAELSRPYDAWSLSQPDAENGLRSVSLGLGRAGVALFYGWAARSGLVPGAAEQSERLLNEAIELLPAKTMDESLFCGFPGVAWTTEHLLRLSGSDTEDDPVAGIDDELVAFLENDAFRPAYDLIGGLAGLGVYSLERYARPTGPRLCGLVLDRLESMARAQETGLSWPSGTMTRRALADDVPPEQTFFNVGLSHGVPGVVGILARLAQIAPSRPRALALLEGSVAWLLAQRLPQGHIGVFPDYVADDAEPEPARLAWCYGDPGVAAALLAASRALGRPSLEAIALDVAHTAAARPLEATGVVDTGLCHGSAGLAHLFHRLHCATGDPECRRAALAWYERCLAPATGMPGVAGFTTFCFERNPDGEYLEDPSWLTGAAGVGLALLAALSDDEPIWDRTLLLDS